MKIMTCGAVLAALALGASGAAPAATHGEGAPSAGAGESANSTVHQYATIDLLQAAANWAGIPNKVEQAAPGIPFLTLLSSDGNAVAFAALLGCQNGKCEGYSTFSIVKGSVISPAVMASYNSKYSYTRLVPYPDKTYFEQQVIVAGGITDDNVHANQFAFFKNMANLTGLVKPVAQSNAPSPAAAALADTNKPGVLAGFADTLAHGGAFMTGAELEKAALADGAFNSTTR